MTVPEQSRHFIYSEMILIEIKERPPVSLSTVNFRPLNRTDTSQLGGSLSCVRACVSTSFSLSGGTKKSPLCFSEGVFGSSAEAGDGA